MTDPQNAAQLVTAIHNVLVDARRDSHPEQYLQFAIGPEQNDKVR